MVVTVVTVAQQMVELPVIQPVATVARILLVTVVLQDLAVVLRAATPAMLAAETQMRAEE
jgi:hypothetical protein